MRIYEELFILRPDAPEEEIDHLIEQLTTFIASQGGNVDKSDKWGIRKLAYRVQKRTEGFYVLLQFTTKPETVLEVERRLRVSDLVMKFQTVRIDEKLKKIEKRKKDREKRAARKPAPPAAAQPAVEHVMAGAAEPAARDPALPCRARPVPAAAARGKGRRITWPNNEADVPLAGPCGPPAAIRRWPPRSNISGARKYADSAWKRSTISITRTCECSRPSFPSAGRSCRGASPVFARRTRRRLAEAIKQARNIALIPFATAI